MRLEIPETIRAIMADYITDNALDHELPDGSMDSAAVLYSHGFKRVTDALDLAASLKAGEAEFDRQAAYYLHREICWLASCVGEYKSMKKCAQDILSALIATN